ncbi:MAG: polysaccharide biosynthesis/export family protein [Pirellulales bacterium]|nr:polysaccharide biosynthesis/export family protein [Pirellulales bacterium]
MIQRSEVHATPPSPLQGLNALGFSRGVLFVVAMVLLVAASGCTSLLSPISGVPAHRLPPELLTKPKNDLVPVDISRLRQPPSPNYLLDADDILGIYIEGVLGDPEQPPPVNIPEGGDTPPSIGYPIPVREDGTLSLPLIPAISVRGLTMTQVEHLIRDAYTVQRQILPPGGDRIIVTLMRKRTYQIIVVREDGVKNQGGGQGGQLNPFAFTQAGRGEVVDLEAYKNDVLHALAETGGLPGLDAKNEVKILRSSLANQQQRDAFVQEYYSNPPLDNCLCIPPIPEDPAVLRIPLRLPPGQIPQFDPNDIILHDGDIVYIESRDREVFYTGGLLGGGVFQLPRDYDLDVIGAMAIAGQGIGQTQGRGGGGIGGGLAQGLGGAPPGQLFILRKTPCGDQLTIAVDLNRAMQSPQARPLVEAGDILILRYKPEEEAVNFALGTFFTFGIRELFRND